MTKTTRMHPAHYAKACPFCGNEHLTIVTTGRSLPMSYVFCSNCQQAGPKATTKRMSVAMYNAAQKDLVPA